MTVQHRYYGTTARAQVNNLTIVACRILQKHAESQGKGKRELLTNDSLVWLGKNTKLYNLLSLIGRYVPILYQNTGKTDKNRNN